MCGTPGSGCEAWWGGGRGAPSDAESRGAVGERSEHRWRGALVECRAQGGNRGGGDRGAEPRECRAPWGGGCAARGRRLGRGVRTSPSPPLPRRAAWGGGGGGEGGGAAQHGQG